MAEGIVARGGGQKDGSEKNSRTNKMGRNISGNTGGVRIEENCRNIGGVAISEMSGLRK